jgi:hypothetical protein
LPRTMPTLQVSWSERRKGRRACADCASASAAVMATHSVLSRVCVLRLWCRRLQETIGFDKAACMKRLPEILVLAVVALVTAFAISFGGSHDQYIPQVRLVLVGVCVRTLCVACIREGYCSRCLVRWLSTSNRS